MGKREHVAAPGRASGATGTLIVYARDGREIHRQEGFVAGQSLMPYGVSMTAGASVVVGEGGEVLCRWNPWGVLSD